MSPCHFHAETCVFYDSFFVWVWSVKCLFEVFCPIAEQIFHQNFSIPSLHHCCFVGRSSPRCLVPLRTVLMLALSAAGGASCGVYPLGHFSCEELSFMTLFFTVLFISLKFSKSTLFSFSFFSPLSSCSLAFIAGFASCNKGCRCHLLLCVTEPRAWSSVPVQNGTSMLGLSVYLRQKVAHFFFLYVPQLYLWGSPLILVEIFAYVTIF